jgi:hypothetical protein
MPYTPMGRFLHIPPPEPDADWVVDFDTPWWKVRAGQKKGQERARALGWLFPPSSRRSGHTFARAWDWMVASGSMALRLTPPPT